MKILVTGVGGQLGYDVCRRLTQLGIEHKGVDVQDFDLTNADAVMDAARSAGAVAGFLGQPAVLDAANSRKADERIEAAYATLFAFAMVVKILLVPVIWNVQG